MNSSQQTWAFRSFAKHIFIVGNVYSNTIRAREDVQSQMLRMRKSIIRMTLSYTDLDALKHKVDKLIEMERKYARFFKAPDTEASELREHILQLESQLKSEREEKHKLVEEQEEKIKELKSQMDSVKRHTRAILLENARRQQRTKLLEKKINKRIDIHSYYHN